MYTAFLQPILRVPAGLELLKICVCVCVCALSFVSACFHWQVLNVKNHCESHIGNLKKFFTCERFLHYNDMKFDAFFTLLYVLMLLMGKCFCTVGIYQHGQFFYIN